MWRQREQHAQRRSGEETDPPLGRVEPEELAPPRASTLTSAGVDAVGARLTTRSSAASVTWWLAPAAVPAKSSISTTRLSPSCEWSTAGEPRAVGRTRFSFRFQCCTRRSYDYRRRRFTLAPAWPTVVDRFALWDRCRPNCYRPVPLPVRPLLRRSSSTRVARRPSCASSSRGFRHGAALRS